MFTGSEVRRVGQGNRTDSAAPMFDIAHAGGLTGGSRSSAGHALVQRSVDDEDDDGDGDDDGDDDAVGDDGADGDDGEERGDDNDDGAGDVDDDDDDGDGDDDGDDDDDGDSDADGDDCFTWLGLLASRQAVVVHHSVVAVEGEVY